MNLELKRQYHLPKLRVFFGEEIINKEPSGESSKGQKESNFLSIYKLLEIVPIKIFNFKNTLEDSVKVIYNNKLYLKVLNSLFNLHFKDKQSFPLFKIKGRKIVVGLEI